MAHVLWLIFYGISINQLAMVFKEPPENLTAQFFLFSFQK